MSHSSLDRSFIHELANKLRAHHVDPWLDTEQIRPGRSWQDVIFGQGIPACSAVFVYFTSNSLSSKVVMKEIDSGLLHKLEDDGVAFLPYVDSESIRQELRSDIRGLQCPVLNAATLEVEVGKLAVEIWRSHSERTLRLATALERSKRLELEAEITRRDQSADVFSKTEHKEFSYIADQLGLPVQVKASVYLTRPKGEPAARALIQMTIQPLPLSVRLFDSLLFSTRREFFEGEVHRNLCHELNKSINPKASHIDHISGFGHSFIRDLRTYDLVSFSREVEEFSDRKTTRNMIKFTPKMARLKYWLGYTSRTLSERILTKAVNWRPDVASDPIDDVAGAGNEDKS